jgi:uncharacterized protein
MSEIIKISLTFLLILILLRKKLNIGYVLLAASSLLFILYTMSFDLIIKTLIKTLTGSITIKLLLALSLIRMFEIILREQNVLSTMMSTVKAVFKKRKAVIISMPMLIGMLPSLGGAYFSAPMVKEAASGLNMSQEEKAFINYWFRHPWEYILPLYPGVLLASAVTSIPLYNIITANLLYALCLFLTGFIYSMRGIEKNNRTTESSNIKGIWPILKKNGMNFVPVFAVLFFVVIVRIELQYALLAIIIPLLLFYKYRPKEILRITKHGFAPDVIVMVLGIILFKETMEASGAVKNLSILFVEHGIPKLPIICILPFLIGLLTGVTVGFVGSTFPLLISIGGASLSDMSLAFAFGFAGVLLSPVHLCLVLTREYFKADMTGLYKKMVPATAIILSVALIAYLILR